jgi:hypothetical protein
MNVRAKINEKKRVKNNKRIKNTHSWFFEKINTLDKPLVKLTKRKRAEKPKLIELEMKKD